jgi:hypothetical protein
MQKRLSWTGGVVGVLLVLFVAVAATGARTLRPGEAALAPAYANVANTAPPNCDEICGEQAACEEVCRFGSDITCGEYAQYAEGPTCVSCESTCTEYSPCDLQCLDGGSLTTCDEVEPECGQQQGPPAENCSAVCVPSSVYCSTPCWNGSSYSPSTCGAEEYPCNEPCYQPGSDYSGLFEDGRRWDYDLEIYVVDCYYWFAYFDYDPCQWKPIQNLDCYSHWAGGPVPEGSCCDTYGWIYGCQNDYGC